MYTYESCSADVYYQANGEWNTTRKTSEVFGDFRSLVGRDVCPSSMSPPVHKNLSDLTSES